MYRLPLPGQIGPATSGTSLTSRGTPSATAQSAPAYISGDYAGNVWNLYTTNTQNGVPALCTVTWGSRVVGNARSRALVKRVYPELEYQAAPPGQPSVTLNLQDAIGGPVTSTSSQGFDITYANSDIYFTTHYHRGRVASVTISDQLGIGWVSDGYDLDWVPGGLR